MVTMTTPTTPTVRDRLKQERCWTDALLSLELDESDCDELIEVITWDHIDNLHQWEAAQPKAKFSVPNRKKVLQQQALNQHGNDHLTSSRKDRLTDMTESPLCQVCVEPTTYRYIPGNGKYRAAKFAQRLEADRPLKKAPVGERLTVEQQSYQKEIKRRLRQDFEAYMKQPIIESPTSLTESHYSAKIKESLNSKNDKEVPLMKQTHRKIKKNFKKDKPPLPPIGLDDLENPEQYFSSRLGIMQEEIHRDAIVRNAVSISPEGRTSRSRSEPPPVPTDFDVLSFSLTRPTENPHRDSVKSDGDVLDIVACLNSSAAIHPGSQYSKDDSNVFSGRPSSRKYHDGLEHGRGSRTSKSGKGANRRYHSAGSSHSDGKSEHRGTHHVRYTTAQGEIVSIPKFGRFVGSNFPLSPPNATKFMSSQAERDAACIKSLLKNKIPTSTAGGVNPSTYNNGLQTVITTTNYISSETLLKSAAVSKLPKGQHMERGQQRAATNGFHSVPVGRQRHREREPRDKVEGPTRTKKQTPMLPELAGRSVPTVVSSGPRFL